MVLFPLNAVFLNTSLNCYSLIILKYIIIYCCLYFKSYAFSIIIGANIIFFFVLTHISEIFNSTLLLFLNVPSLSKTFKGDVMDGS